jgi:hypothetical protein
LVTEFNYYFIHVGCVFNNFNKMKSLEKLYNDENQLRETIKYNELTIDELRKENVMLKNKLKDMEEHIAKQDIEIIGLKEHGVQQDIEIIGLKEHGVQQDIIITGLKEHGVQQDIIITGLKEHGVQQDIIITGLRKDIVELKIENKELKEHGIQQDIIITGLKDDIVELKKDNKKFLDIVIELKARDDPLTVREALSTLEQKIMFEIVGSNRTVKKFNGIYQLSQDKIYQNDYNQYLTKYGLTEDHIELLIDIKTFGNKIAHTRPLIARKEWDELIISMLDDPTNVKDIQLIKDILTLMEKYYPVPLTGEWILK